MNMPSLMRASGLWDTPMDRGSLQVFRAFYQRPWEGRCNIDDVIMLAAKYGVDTLPLMKMLVETGELDEDI